MVAPSFQQLKQVGEPFYKGQKCYVTVITAKGTERTVRWYTEKEYEKSFGTKKEKSSTWDMRAARGFSKGPVYVLRNLKSADEEWCCATAGVRFAVDIGWHIPSETPIPADLPDNIKTIPLSFDDFKGPDDQTPKAPALLAAIISKKEKMIV